MGQGQYDDCHEIYRLVEEQFFFFAERLVEDNMMTTMKSFIDIIILQRGRSCLLCFIYTILSSPSLPRDVSTVSQLIKKHLTNQNSLSCLKHLQL